MASSFKPFNAFCFEAASTIQSMYQKSLADRVGFVCRQKQTLLSNSSVLIPQTKLFLFPESFNIYLLESVKKGLDH